MLIKLTDRCSMMCPHCMEDARPDGEAMISREVLARAVTFGRSLGCRVFTLSGGEPTEHPNFRNLCAYLDGRLRAMNGMFTICSNGMWLKDKDKTDDVKAVLRLPTCMGMQVYTHRRWYREYDYVMAHRSDYEAIEKVKFDPDDTIWMQDLGRARHSEDAQREVAASPYFMSCLNATLVARQAEQPQMFGSMLEMRGQFCRPQVDALGGVHLSESRLCLSVGNVVSDDPEQIYQRMRRQQPCGQCAGYRRFAQSQRPDIVRARQVLDINETERK